MKILVTGGAGYIGSACVAKLLPEGHEVVVYDDLSTGQAEKVPEGARLVEGSLLDVSKLEELCRAERFEAVMHCAAKKAVGESEEKPEWYFEHNVVGSQNLLSIITKYGVQHLVFSSTAAVYAPNSSTEPFTEKSPLGPVSVYGTTKLIVEQMIKDYARVGRLPRYTILRYFNVAGDAGLNYKEHKAENVFPLIAKSVVGSVPFRIFGDDYETKDGTGVRDYIHLADLAEAHVLALRSSASLTCNLGTETGYTVRELVDTFSTLLGRVIPVEVVGRRPGDAAVVIASATLARRELGWQPKETLEKMVSDTLDVYGLK
jgi:UDP-glucose 4-epimerase